MARRDHRSRWIPALLIAAIVMLIVLAPAGRAAAAENGSYGIRPANEADFFNLSVAPGSALDAEAIVTNSTDEPVTLLTYPVDATSQANGFAMENQESPRTGVGAWVQIESADVTVPANSEVRVPFRLSVPTGTRPGDYAGALIIQAPPEEGEVSELEDGTAVRLDVVQRLGVRIYLDVAGEAVVGLEPGELTWEREGGSLTFSMPIINTGNTNLSPEVQLELEGWPGEPRQATFESTEDLLTGSTHVLEANIDDPGPFFFGDAEATIASDAGEARVSESVVYADWQLLLVAVLVLAVLVLIAWRVTRFVRRARRAIAELEGRGAAA